jgi:hypothetical protein
VAKEIFHHPLSDVVLGLLAKRGGGDSLTVAVDMGAPSRPTSAIKAYKLVATDVLHVLYENGYLEHHPVCCSSHLKNACYFKLTEKGKRNGRP